MRVDEVEWRTIPGCDAYDVSSDGRIRRSRPGRGKAKRQTPYLLKLSKDESGYRRTTLMSDRGERRCVLVHRLVAEGFLPNPLGLPQVSHLDNDKLNNAMTNLEWGTQKTNLAHQLIHGTRLRGDRSPHAKLTEEQVRSVRCRRARGEPAEQIAAEFGVSRHHVYALAAMDPHARLPPGHGG